MTFSTFDRKRRRRRTHPTARRVNDLIEANGWFMALFVEYAITHHAEKIVEADHDTILHEIAKVDPDMLFNVQDWVTCAESVLAAWEDEEADGR